MEPLRVLMLTSSYPRFRGDPASIFLKHLCVSLVKKGIQVHVLAPSSDVADEQIKDGVHVQRFKYFPRMFRKLCYGSGILPNLRNNPFLWIAVPFFLVAMYFSLIRTIKTIKPDIVHCHWIIPQGLIAILAKPFHHSAIIVSAHGADAFSFRSGISRFLKKFVITNCDHWTANTKVTAAAVYKPIPACNLSIIPMAVDTSFFKPGKGEHLRSNLPFNTVIFLFVGRLVEKKGVSVLLEAYSRLQPDIRRQTRLWIVGDGSLRPRLETEAIRLQISEQTTFWGRQPNEDLPDFYSAADIFVGPSLVDPSGDTEGQGVVFLEAMSSGTPVIATTTGGIPEVIKNESTGLLVPPNDPVALNRDMIRLLKDEAYRKTLGSNGQQEVASKYDWSVVSGQFFHLYSDILKKSFVRTT